MGLSQELSIIKQSYREIFFEAQASLLEQLEGLRTAFSCETCSDKNVAPTLEARLHPGCGYQPWQRAAISFLEKTVGQDILAQLNGMNEKKAQYTCHQCGVCCRFASSEFSYTELQAKAAQGDRFATEFTSIFLPYASQAAAHQKFPELVDQVLTHAEADQAVYFYHCPYIGEDNRCSIYKDPKRPSICASYPDTPLTFIYEKCAWYPWKEATHADALKAHATIELAFFYIQKLNQALEETP